jgi:hypothetical protein
VTISVVLRLSSTALSEGRLAGGALLAETGQNTMVADAAELVAFVLAHQPALPGPLMTLQGARYSYDGN